MHIPSCETVKIQLPAFETALKDALLPNDRYDIRHWLYVPNQYTELSSERAAKSRSLITAAQYLRRLTARTPL